MNRNQFSTRVPTFAFLEANAREKDRWTEKVRRSCLISQFRPHYSKKKNLWFVKMHLGLCEQFCRN